MSIIKIIESNEENMTDYQFQRYEELRDKCEAVTRELNTLREGINEQSKGNLTSFQYKTTIEMIYQILKANFEAGKSSEEILSVIAGLNNVVT